MWVNFLASVLEKTNKHGWNKEKACRVSLLKLRVIMFSFCCLTKASVGGQTQQIKNGSIWWEILRIYRKLGLEMISESERMRGKGHQNNGWCLCRGIFAWGKHFLAFLLLTCRGRTANAEAARCVDEHYSLFLMVVSINQSALFVEYLSCKTNTRFTEIKNKQLNNKIRYADEKNRK